MPLIISLFYIVLAAVVMASIILAAIYLRQIRNILRDIQTTQSFFLRKLK